MLMSNTPSSPITTKASPPFERSSADIILRTSDRVDFHVHKQILSQASPVFASMFSLPQPTAPIVPYNSSIDYGCRASEVSPTWCDPAFPAAQAELSVIDVEEESSTLDPLLRFCYPVKKHAFVSVDEIEPVLRAATEYEMEWPTEVITERLFELASTSPLRVWAIGCRLRLEDVARRGAEACVKAFPQCVAMEVPLIPNMLETLRGMEGISAGDYVRLLMFFSCEETASADFCLLKSTALMERVFSETAAELTALRLWQELPYRSGEVVDPEVDVTFADVVCKSDDGARFPTHRIVLSLHSPILRERILASERDAVYAHELTVLELDESADILAYLLSACYNGDQSLPQDIDTLTILLASAKKYQMARILPMIKHSWNVQSKWDPVWAYICALRCGLRGCAQVAAKESIRVARRLCYGGIFELSPAREYHQLLVYQHSCQEAVQDVLRSAKERWIKKAALYKSQGITDTNISVAWVESFVEELEESWLGSPADLQSLAKGIWERLLKKRKWGTLCNASKSMAGELAAFAKSVPQEIEDAVDMVKLKF